MIRYYLPQHFTIFRIKIVYGNNILKKANVIVYMLFLLLSEFNSCIELSKTLRIFGINVSHDIINRILWNEGFNPQEKLFNFIKNFITPRIQHFRYR